MYETPEVFELGDVEELTFGSVTGCDSDGLDWRKIRFCNEFEQPIDQPEA